MADILSSPWILTPADEGAEIRPPQSSVFLTSIVFTNYTDPDHRCVIEDGFGRVVFDQKGIPGFDPIQEMFSGRIMGLKLVQLDSGLCRVHIR